MWDYPLRRPAAFMPAKKSRVCASALSGSKGSAPLLVVPRSTPAAAAAAAARMPHSTEPTIFPAIPLKFAARLPV